MVLFPSFPSFPQHNKRNRTWQGIGIPWALWVYILLLSYCCCSEGFLLVMSQVPFFLDIATRSSSHDLFRSRDHKWEMSSLPNGVIFVFIVLALSKISNQLVGHFDPFLLYFLSLWLPCTPKGLLSLCRFVFLSMDWILSFIEHNLLNSITH